MVEQDSSDSIIFAATNHIEILDHALFRRFDDIIDYELPEKTEIVLAFKSKLASSKVSRIEWQKLALLSDGLSFADITHVCEDAIKNVIINRKPSVTTAELVKSISDRKRIRKN